MLCIMSWFADTQELEDWPNLELPTDAFQHAEPAEGGYHISWAPCGSKDGRHQSVGWQLPASGCESGLLMMWIVSSQAQVAAKLPDVALSDAAAGLDQR